MHSFATYEGVFGAAAQSREFREFKQLHCDMRRKLKIRRYLLDEYIHKLLDDLNGSLCNDFDESLFEAMREHLCELLGSEDEMEHLVPLVTHLFLVSQH